MPAPLLLLCFYFLLLSHLFCHSHILSLSFIFYSFLLVFFFDVSSSTFAFAHSFSFLCHSVLISFFFLSPALLLTSSAVLRPLHEANAHSGLAVAACMRSTGGPIKRRQDQEMERETGSARSQWPRRYHHCPPLCVRSGACLKTTSDPLPPSPPSLPHFVCVLSSSCSQTHLRTPQLGSSGCWLSKNTLICMSSALAALNSQMHYTLTSCCMCVCVSHTLNFIQYCFVSVCLMQCSENLLCWALLLPSRMKRETELLSAFPCFTASLHRCCCAALCSCALPRLPSLSVCR